MVFITPPLRPLSVIVAADPLFFTFPADDLLINEATREQLMRRKRAELLRLSRVAGLLDADANNSSLIKSHLVDGILATVRSQRLSTQSRVFGSLLYLVLSSAIFSTYYDLDPSPINVKSVVA